MMDSERPVAETVPVTASQKGAPVVREELVRRELLIPSPHPSLGLEQLGRMVRCRRGARAALRAERDAR